MPILTLLEKLASELFMLRLVGRERERLSERERESSGLEAHCFYPICSSDFVRISSGSPLHRKFFLSGLPPKPSLTKPVIPIFLIVNMQNMRINPRHTAKYNFLQEKQRKTQVPKKGNAEHADDQPKRKRTNWKIGKGGFVNHMDYCHD